MPNEKRALQFRYPALLLFVVASSIVCWVLLRWPQALIGALLIVSGIFCCIQWRRFCDPNVPKGGVRQLDRLIAFLGVIGFGSTLLCLGI